jgi:hypothetical protein
MLEALMEAAGPTATICAVMGMLAFMLHDPATGVALLGFAAAMLIMAAVTIAIQLWRGDW